MKMQRAVFLATMATIAGFAGPAMAYVGPGAGLSVVSALIGVLLAVGAAVVFIVGWPIRRAMRRRKQLASGRQYSRDEVSREEAKSSPAQ